MTVPEYIEHTLHEMLMVLLIGLLKAILLAGVLWVLVVLIIYRVVKGLQADNGPPESVTIAANKKEIARLGSDGKVLERIS